MSDGRERVTIVVTAGLTGLFATTGIAKLAHPGDLALAFQRATDVDIDSAATLVRAAAVVELVFVMMLCAGCYVRGWLRTAAALLFLFAAGLGALLLVGTSMRECPCGLPWPTGIEASIVRDVVMAGGTLVCARWCAPRMRIAHRGARLVCSVLIVAAATIGALQAPLGVLATSAHQVSFGRGHRAALVTVSNEGVEPIAVDRLEHSCSCLGADTHVPFVLEPSEATVFTIWEEWPQTGDEAHTLPDDAWVVIGTMTDEVARVELW